MERKREVSGDWIREKGVYTPCRFDRVSLTSVLNRLFFERLTSVSDPISSGSKFATSGRLLSFKLERLATFNFFAAHLTNVLAATSCVEKEKV